MVMAVLRFNRVYLIVSLFAAAALLVDTWPQHPKSLLHWALLLLIALPVIVLGEWLTDGLVNNPLSEIIERGTRRSSFSWARIAYYLAIYVLFGIAAVTLFHWAQT
jgi:hypothetical protein